MFNNSKRKYNAFTLVEALVAISILLTGIISGFILVTRSLYNAKLIQDRLTASFLAQEGIELVRKIRDSNYVKNIQGDNIKWNKDLEPNLGPSSMEPSSSYYIQINPINKSVELTQCLTPCEESRIPQLKYNDEYGFNYTSGEDTNFTRIIRIDVIDDKHLRVSSIVTWKTRNIPFLEKTGGIKAEDHLYNWLSY